MRGVSRGRGIRISTAPRTTASVRPPASAAYGSGEENWNKLCREERQGERQQDGHQQRSAQVVDPGSPVSPVGQPQQSQEQNRRLRHVEPEYPPPIRKLDDCSAKSRTQHGPGFRRAAHNPQRDSLLMPWYGLAGNRHPDGNGCSSAHGLDYPGPYHPLQAARDGHQACPGREHRQGSLVRPGVPIYVRYARDQRHRHGVAQQISGNDP